jgi:hypothetical protein
VQDLDSNQALEVVGATSRFFLSSSAQDGEAIRHMAALEALFKSWPDYCQRLSTTDEQWFPSLCEHLDQLVQERIDVVQRWINLNTSRFTENTSAMETLRRESNSIIAELRANVQLCGMKCKLCHLHCLAPRHHDSNHDCLTSHGCIRPCDFIDQHCATDTCGLP